MGHSDILAAFSDARADTNVRKPPPLTKNDPTFVGPLPQSHYKEEAIDHCLGTKYHTQVFRLTAVGFGTGGSFGADTKCGIYRDGEFIHLRDAFPGEFPPKR